MPHGGGSHGGGGYSGGGYHGGYYHHGRGGGKRCTPGGCLCTMYLVVASGLITAALILVFSVFGASTVALSPRATRLLKLNTMFNQAASLYTNSKLSAGISAYVLDAKPPLSPKPDHFVLEKETYISWDNYEYWSFNLIPPSHAELVVSSKERYEFYLFRSHRNFNQFEQKSENRSIAGYQFRPHGSTVQNVTVFNGSVSQDDVYYFVLARDHHTGSRTGRIELRLSVQRSLYDVSNISSLLSCNLTLDDGGDCSQHLPYATERFALFVGGNSSDMEFAYYGRFKLEPRALLYLAVFALPGIIISVFAIFVARRVKYGRFCFKTSSVSVTNPERHPLTADASKPDYNQATALPPSYPGTGPGTMPPSYPGNTSGNSPPPAYPVQASAPDSNYT